MPSSSKKPSKRGRERLKQHNKDLLDPRAGFVHFAHAAWPILEPATRLDWNWHLNLICEYLTLVESGRFREFLGQKKEGIIFNVPPRTMKSLLITVLFPAWMWTRHPERRFMFVSYSERLSTQHSLLRRNLMQSRWYRGIWGNVFQFSGDQNRKEHYENSETGTMFSTAMRGTATGMGGDILVFDDPMNPEQSLSASEREAVNLRFDTTFRSRINNPTTGLKILVMQRLHEQDLAGHILRKEPERWVHVKLPAIQEQEQTYQFPLRNEKSITRKARSLLWPARLPAEFLESQRAGMGSWAFAGRWAGSLPCSSPWTW